MPELLSKAVIAIGFFLFAAVGIAGENLPVGAICIGPLVMVTGIVLSRLRKS